MKISSLLKNKEIKNMGWLVGEQVFQMGVSFIVGILTARYLGPSDFGSLNYTASFVTFITPVATLGMEGVVIKKLIAHPNEEGDYLGSCFALRLGASILSSISIIAAVWLLNMDDKIKLILVALQSLQLVFQAFYILDQWFQRYLRSKYTSIGKMAACIVVSSYKAWLLITNKSVEWFAFSNALTYVVISFMLYLFYRKSGGQKLTFSFSRGFEVLGESYHFILSGLMSAAYSQMDRIMIGKMISDSGVGLYTVATTICGFWIFVPNAIITSFRPKILETKQSGNEKLYIRRLEQLYSGIIWLCIFASAFICVFARLIIHILYGDSYMGAITTLRIAIWFETFAMIGNARGIWILCEDKNKYVKYYLGIGAGINFVLNYILISFIGIEGAAIATLITQIVTSLIAPLFFKGTRRHTKIVFEAFYCKWYFDTRKGRKI